jgi:hypothetical protein
MGGPECASAQESGWIEVHHHLTPLLAESSVECQKLSQTCRMKRIGLFVLALAAGCSPDASPPPRLFFSCGDPVCRGYTGGSGLPRCTSAQVAGASCGAEGPACDPADECNRVLVCSRDDPTRGTGGCPISLAAFKKDIRYLDAREVEHQRDEVLRIPLATWRYRWERDDAPARLGFLIDDLGPAACVRPSGERVDLYGYASMTVAAVQAQQREIDALRREVADLRAAVRAREPRR